MARWQKQSAYKDDVGTWLTAPGVVARFKIPSSNLHRWGKKQEDCRFLGGRPIRTQWVPELGQLVYLLTDVEQVAAGMRAAKGRAAPFRDQDGRTWLTNRQVRDAHGVSQAFCCHWARTHSRVRPGQKVLRSRKIVNPERHKRGSPGKVWVYLQADVEAVLRGEESSYKAPRYVGYRSWSDVQRWLADLLSAGPVLRDEVLAQARKQRISHCKLWEAKVVLLIESRRAWDGRWFWCRRDQATPQPAGGKESALYDLLAAGPLPPRVVALRMAEKGVTAKELAALKEKVGARSVLSADTAGLRSLWLWELPGHGRRQPGGAGQAAPCVPLQADPAAVGNQSSCPIQVEGQRVSVRGSVVHLDMTEEGVGNAIHFLSTLIGRLGQWVSGPEIGRCDRSGAMAGVRWDRLLKRLPVAVTARIQSNRKLGYRLVT